METKSAHECYEEGNERYRNGDYVSALDCYSYAILSRPELHDRHLAMKLLLNRAQCNLNLREYVAAVKDCTSVLHLDDLCIKAYIRRAIAYENLGKFKEGLLDTEKAMINPPISLIDVILKLSSRLKKLLLWDEKTIEKEGRPDRMVTNEQTLRLNFLETIPNNVEIEQSFLVRLCIGNEFGLWDRSFLSPVISSDIVYTSNMNKNEEVLAISPINLNIEIIYLSTNHDSSVQYEKSGGIHVISKEQNRSLGRDGKVFMYDVCMYMYRHMHVPIQIYLCLYHIHVYSYISLYIYIHLYIHK
jgi:tetratricopeptide (TPR) repeat protein